MNASKSKNPTRKIGDFVKCPYCSSLETKVVDKRAAGGSESTRRRRECLLCSKRFTTYERVETSITVLKSSGATESFDREKLRLGIMKACQKLPVEESSVDSMVESIETELMRSSDDIASAQIGDLVLARLKNLNHVAYMRYASICKQFSDIGSFEKELASLKDRRDRINVS